MLEKKLGHNWNISAPTCTQDKKCSRCGKVEKATGHTWNRTTATCTEDRKCTKCGTVDQKAFGHHSDMPTATCTQDKVCSTCGYVMEKATGHKWNLSAPNCTTDRKCTKCGKIDKKATGHSWNRTTASCTEDQKCKTCGAIGQKAFGHNSSMPTATCTEDKVCSTCGIVLEKATGHKWNMSAATCTEDKKCTKCGKVEKATGHTWNRMTATCTEDRKCTVCGTVDQKAFGHHSDMPTATCTEDKVCSTCGIVLEKATGHKWNMSAATCTEGKKCTRCGKIEKATGHVWNRTTANCTEDRKCTVCGTVDQRAFGHHSDMPTATCTEDKVCSTCGLILEKATGHSWNRSTPGCTEDRMCNRCGKVEKATGHFWSPASCTEPEKCKNCGAVGQPAFGHHAKNPSASCREDNICTTCGIVLEKKLDHKWDKAEATCTEAQKCINCGITGEKAKGHDFSVLVREVAPTCGEAGFVEYKCSRCSETRGENKSSNQPHNWVEKEKVKETTESDGYIIKYCPVCGKEEKTILPRVRNLVLDVDRLSFSENADSRDVNLLNITNAGSIVPLVDQSAAGWVKVTRKGNNGSFKVEVSQNAGDSRRMGVITFKDTEYNRTISIEVLQSSQAGCRIIFDPNGGIGWHEIVTRMVVRGDGMSGVFPAPPQAPAYKAFDGWYTQKQGGVKWTEVTRVPNSQNITLYAHWTDKQYYIAYDGNGAQQFGVMDNTHAVCNQEVALAKNKFSKDGYVLAGWNTRRDGQGTEYAEEAVVKNLCRGDAENGTVVTLYAHWVERKEVKVTFNANGGSDPDNRLAKETRTVAYKEAYGNLPTLPGGVTPPEGKVFAGWETKDHVLVTATSDVQDATDHVLYAVWRENSYIIHFEGNGNLYGVMDDMICTYGADIKFPDCAFDDGTGFECWSTSRTGTGANAANYKAGAYSEALVKDTSIEKITLYAVWKEHAYSVGYYDQFQGECLHKDEKQDVEHIYHIRDYAPTIEGLRFLGYTTDSSFKGLIPEGADRSKLYQPGDDVVFDGDVWLYCVYETTKADWIPVIYHDNGGDIPSRAEYIHWNTEVYQVPTRAYYDLEEHAAELPHKTGYVFEGWGPYTTSRRYDALSSLKINRGTKVVHLYAIWSPNGAKVTLDYGYEGKQREELNQLDKGTFFLPKPKRNDYIFLGWESDYDGTIYQAEEEIKDLPTDLVLTALWEQRTYQIEFIDSYSGKVLKSGRYLSSDRLDCMQESPVIGKTFKGWRYNSKTYSADALVSEFVDMKTPNVLDTILNTEDKVYKLYTSFQGVNEDGKVTVYYHLNSPTAVGGPTKPSTAERKTGNISIETSGEAPTDPHRVFLGWTTTINGRTYTPAGETYIYQGNPTGRVAPPEEITLYACWASKYTLVLDKNGSPDSKLDSITLEDVVPGQVIEMKKYKKSFGEPKGYVLLGWGTTPDTVSIGVDGEFTVPEKDTTLYAIWSSKDVVFRFYDACGREIARRNVKYNSTVTISELDIPSMSVELSAYRFAGWDGESGATSKRYSLDEAIPVTKDITFYAAYEEIPGIAGKVIIHYLANGGEGVPAMEIMDSGDCYLSRIVPTRDGYIFRGWSRHDIRSIGWNMEYYHVAEYPVGEENKVAGKSGDRIVMYAVWERNDAIANNDLKETLESIYGVGAFGDDKLLSVYASYDWEKLNDTTYYVIRTFRRAKLKDYESVVMVMQYLNGTWNLDAYGAIEGFWSGIRFNVLTSLPNTSARALDVTFDVVNTAAELGISFFCPEAGKFVSGLHYLAMVYEVLQKEQYNEFYEALLAEGWQDLGRITGEVDQIGLGKVIDKVCERTDLSLDKQMLYKDLALAVFQEAETLIKQESEELDPYGSFDYAFGIFKERVAGQNFHQTIVDHTYIPIKQIYDYVNSHITGF
ncbi:MAG: InlB B-repeat-containing protein [Lachnospiraceae bacterium]|nr:InlB B-repeat-containing protein [Lachnospiraceae bacterium]